MMASSFSGEEFDQPAPSEREKLAGTNEALRSFRAGERWGGLPRKSRFDHCGKPIRKGKLGNFPRMVESAKIPAP
jgi:hypothetical protein